MDTRVKDEVNHNCMMVAAVSASDPMGRLASSIRLKARAAVAAEIQEPAQEDWEEARRAISGAEKALKALKLFCLQEIKELGKPPEELKLTFEVVCEVTVERGFPVLRRPWPRRPRLPST